MEIPCFCFYLFVLFSIFSHIFPNSFSHNLALKQSLDGLKEAPMGATKPLIRKTFFPDLEDFES